MRIYTRKGDYGMTGIHGGERVPKTDIRIEANGTLDELNSIVGIVRSFIKDADKDDTLREIQVNLMTAMSIVATPSASRDINPRRLPDGAVAALEEELDRISGKGCVIQEFVLPGGCQTAAFMHHARAVCRRAERQLWRLNAQDKVEEDVMIYVNRLSDLFFAMAREVNCDEGVNNERWKRFGKAGLSE